MTESMHPNATCADCGRPVLFVQRGPHEDSAACVDDPHHKLGA